MTDTPRPTDPGDPAGPAGLPHRVRFPSPLVRVDGSLELEDTGRGIRPRRLPAWTRPQLPDPFFDLGVQTAAGVRLVVRTEAKALALTVHTTRLQVAGEEAVPAALDLVADGGFADGDFADGGSADDEAADGDFAGGELTDRGAVRRVPLTGGDLAQLASPHEAPGFLAGEAETALFTGLPSGEKEVRIWLPHTAACDLVALAADAELLPPGPPSGPRWVHYGSSISHCLEAEGPTGTWPAVAAAAAGLHGTNLGFAGNAMLDPFVARTLRDLPADLITLKAGINIAAGATMRLRTFLPAVHGFLDTVREGHPRTPLVVISPLPCPALEERPGPAEPDPETGAPRATGDPEDVALGALTLAVIRTELERLVAERRGSDPELHYLDGRKLLKPNETDELPDGLHPSATAYRTIGLRFADLISPCLNGR